MWEGRGGDIYHREVNYCSIFFIFDRIRGWKAAVADDTLQLSGVSSFFGHPECIFFFSPPNFLFIWLSNLRLFLSLEIFVNSKYLFCHPLELSRPRWPFRSPPHPLFYASTPLITAPRSYYLFFFCHPVVSVNLYLFSTLWTLCNVLLHVSAIICQT